MTIKSLLLGAAAGIATIGAAQAADLPMTKAEAVEYVKVCSAFGPGFFYIPGTDTCLKISGNYRADYGYNSVSSGRLAGNATNRGVDRTSFQGRAQLTFDARNQTDWGVLRSVLTIDAATGNPGSQNWQIGSTYSGSKLYVDKAYIQFGGLTAGYAESAYDFFDAYYGDTIFAPYAGADATTQQLTYTATFGGGFSATASLEDPAAKRSGVYGSDVLGTPGTAVTNAGTQSPDIIANLAYSGPGSDYNKLQIMGALHQVRTLGQDNGLGDNHTSNKWGYAVGAGGSWAIPVLAGGYVSVEGDYADGASAYTFTNFNTYSAAGSPATPDAWDVNGSEKTAHSWSVVTENAVNLTPDLQAMIFGSYGHYTAPGGVQATGLGTGFTAYVVGGQLTYTVVKGLTIAGEVSYENTRSKVAGFNTINGASTNDQVTLAKAKTDSIVAGIRIKRTF